MTISYKSSGVDINKAESFVRAIQSDVVSTKQPGVIFRKGAFGGLFGLDTRKYKNPVIVSSTDGVGTKLLLAKTVGKHDTVGIDLVAMNVNDILCVGAKPLFFLDYIACGRLNPLMLKSVVKGIAKGCQQATMSLIGGETAEMPGMYKDDEYDLAGFAVGVVDKRKIIDGHGIKRGDQIIGLPSSGLHSNGYSLVRKVFSKSDQRRMADELLKPTRIYVKEILSLIERFTSKVIRGIAHNTGGAFYEKITKVLPEGKCFKLEVGSWPVPDIFEKIQKKGRIPFPEMYRTFNMGIGMVIVVAKKDVHAVGQYLNKLRIKHYNIGEVIVDGKNKVIFHR